MRFYSDWALHLNFSLHILRGMSWRTVGRCFHMTTHMIQLTKEAPHLHPRRRYPYSPVHPIICFNFLLSFLTQKKTTFVFFFFLKKSTKDSNIFFPLDFSWLGVWCPESCIWWLQCLHFCLRPNRLWEVLHHDGPYRKTFSQLFFFFFF